MKMQKKDRFYFPISLTLLFFLGAGLTGCEKEEAQANPEIEAEIIKTVRIASPFSYQTTGTRHFPAIVEASEKTDLAFRIAGQLNVLAVKAGDKVKKGQLIAQLDTKDYQNTLDDRKAKLNLAETQYKQREELYKKNYVSQSTMDTFKADLRIAKVAVEQAQTSLSYTNLYAPFDGVVSHVSVENYQFIQPQQSIVQLQNNQQLDIRFDVPEALVKTLKRTNDYSHVCGSVEIESPGYTGKTFKACYKEHDSIPDAQTRSYPVLFSLSDSENASLLPGMSVQFTIDLSGLAASSSAQGVLVPVEAVFDAEDKQWIWKVADDMRIHKTEVNVNGLAEGQVLITKGLSASDKVVAAGVSHLAEGQKVRPFVRERGL